MFPNKKPLIIAHRGASAFAPENTLAAFRRAVADGADGIEFDVRLAKDNVPVVVHDSNLKRLANLDRRVSDFTSVELQKIDVGSWFNRQYPARVDEKFAAEIVPTLEQILEFLADFKGLIYIELKCRAAEAAKLVEAVCPMLEHSPLLPQIIVKSFRLNALPIVRRLLPEVKIAALFAPKIITILRKEKRLVRVALDVEADQISVHYSLATRKLLKRATKENLPVTIWTADNPRFVKRAVKMGIGAVITNNPARLIAKRDKLAGKSSLVD